MQDRLLKIQEVMDITSLSRSSIYRMKNAGEFPQPIKIGSRAVRWRLSDINAWMDSKTSGRPYMLSLDPARVGLKDRSRIRVWRQYVWKLAGHAVGPLLHQVSAAFEQVRSRVGLFSRVA